MYIVDMYLRVRRACLVEGMGIREASRVFGLAPRHRAQDALAPRATGIPQEASSPLPRP